jgi:RNA polymerase sigma factor (sigma-70 family)
LSLDDLFNEFKAKEGEAKDLLDKIAKEAQSFCMKAVYWDRRRFFYKNISENQAISVFNDLFMKCVERSLEGKSKTLSGCMIFYFERRLKDFRKKTKKLPIPLTDEINNPEIRHENYIDNKTQDKDNAPDPDARIDARSIVILLLDNFETLPRFERDALILNNSGFSHSEIAQFFGVEKQIINKKKYQARERLRKLLPEEE